MRTECFHATVISFLTFVPLSLCGCGSSGTTPGTDAGPEDGSAAQGSDGAIVNGADAHAPGDAGSAEGDATIGIGSGDGGAPSTGGDGAPSGNGGDAGGGGESDGACTTPAGGPYACGASLCNGATSICLETMTKNTCEPLPAECGCAETIDCACLVAHVENPCDAGILQCKPMDDGGLHWIQAIDCF